MQGNKIKLKIITHQKIVFEKEVDALYTDSVNGRFGLLPNHIPLISALKIGVTKAIDNDKTFYITTMGGVLQFRDNEAIILTDLAELGNDIDLARANQAKERAQARIDAKKDKNDVLRAQFALAKAIARISAGSKHI